MAAAIKAGYKPVELPEVIDDEDEKPMWAIIGDCWRQVPTERPSATDCLQRIINIDSRYLTPVKPLPTTKKTTGTNSSSMTIRYAGSSGGRQAVAPFSTSKSLRASVHEARPSNASRYSRG